MKKFKLWTNSKLGFLVYIFFYLINTNFAISQNYTNDLINQLENSLNSNNKDKLYSFFEKEEGLKIEKKFKKFTSEFKNINWQFKKLKRKSLDYYVVNIKLTGSRKNGRTEFLLESKFNYLFNLKNGKIKSGFINNHLTTIRNDNNNLNILFQIPNKVLTGSEYDIDIVLKDPLENQIIAGIVNEHPEESIFKEELILEPLAAGGIFKVTRAPSKPGIQIWSGMIAHPDGLISFTKTVSVVDKI